MSIIECRFTVDTDLIYLLVQGIQQHPKKVHVYSGLLLWALDAMVAKG